MVVPLRRVFAQPKPSPEIVTLLSTLGVSNPQGTSQRQGKNWSRHQACHQGSFTLVALESHHTGAPSVGYTDQEDYIKVNFWLSGRHTTGLTGYGEREHDRPEVFITCGPPDMIKVDMLNADTHIAAVALCLLSDFFPQHMGLALEDLPEPLRAMALATEKPHAFHSFSLTPDLLSAARAILAAPFTVRGDPIYAQAKAVELMCLLMNRMTAEGTDPHIDKKARRQQSRLYEARGILAQHYAQDLTLEQIAREVGLNKLALTSGFRQLFGMSVYDCLQKERLDHAFELLQDPAHSIDHIAEAVGYSHSCNFSTAFRARFGCTPHAARGRGARN